MHVAAKGALALGGAGLVFGGFVFIELGTGKPNLDALRLPLISGMARNGVVSLEFGRSMMAIFHNEHSNGNPSHDITDPMQLGDQTLSGGPSIGPGQVYRKTAIDLGLWDASKDREAYAAFGSDPANLWELTAWACTVFKDKLRIADGDYAKARELYNGSGDSAIAYEENTEKFLAAQAWQPGTSDDSGAA